MQLLQSKPWLVSSHWLLACRPVRHGIALQPLLQVQCEQQTPVKCLWCSKGKQCCVLCRPNAAYHFRSRGSLVVRSLAHIAAGDEVCIAYLDCSRPLQQCASSLRACVTLAGVRLCPCMLLTLAASVCQTVQGSGDACQTDQTCT